MRIACLMASISRSGGGVSESVRRLCQSLDSHPDTEIYVLGTRDEHTAQDAASWAPLPTHVFAVRGPCQFGYAPGMKEKLFELDVDLVLAHGLWMYPSVVALDWHRRTRRPFVINPHGMLDPWALNNSGWKKRLAGLLYENSCLRQAACLRALSSAEARSVRAYGLPNRICIVPHGIDLPGGNVIPPPWKERVETGRKTLLYLGRIHPKKGLSGLLRAWALLHHRGFSPIRDWDLVIAGWSQDHHESELKNLARQLGIAPGVHFVGPQFGDAKAAAYQRADAFVLPSLSEGLPVAVLEAWAQGLPVVMSPQCHLPEGFAVGAALRAAPETASLAQTLEALFSMTGTERTRMGGRGRRLVAARFDSFKVGTQMHDVCRWLLGQADAPDSLLADREEIQTHEPSLT
jgi:glycosyltransferase involved in cell wall biosynthesis